MSNTNKQTETTPNPGKDANSDLVLEENKPWGKWLAELQTLLGHPVATFDGWGECYGAGLTPAQAIACRDHGVDRDMVIDYCSTSDIKYNLVFD